MGVPLEGENSATCAGPKQDADSACGLIRNHDQKPLKDDVILETPAGWGFHGTRDFMVFLGFRTSLIFEAHHFHISSELKFSFRF